MGALGWWDRKLFYRLSKFLFILIGILFIGTAGFYFIEDWSFVDSIYMTIITISTVGFSEVSELSSEGKLFTAALIVGSFGTFAYAITSITNYLVGGEYKKFIRQKKLMGELQDLKDHVIICGFGRVGRQVADDLASVQTPYVILEFNSELVESKSNDPMHFFLNGDATDDKNLKLANIDTAKAVITCLPKDADNVYVVLTAREQRKDITIISRANEASAVSKLKIAGANNVILPDSIGGSHMASLISNPDVMEFLDILRVQGFEGANVNSVSFNELPENFRNKTIGQLEANKISGVTIIGFKTQEGDYIINPNQEIVVVPHSKLFVLGSPDQISRLKEHFGLKH